MALSDIQTMSNNGSLRGRVVAAAAIAGKDQAWAMSNLVAICATKGWDEAWSTGVGQGAAYNPDTGARPDVITDQMIHDGVAAVIAAQTPTEEQA